MASRWRIRAIDPSTRLAIVFAVAILLVTAAVEYRSVRTVRSDAHWVDHTYQVIGVLTDLSRRVSEAESGTLGFVLSAEDRVLDPYREAIAGVDPAIARLAVLTSDNPSQQDGIPALTRAMHAELDALARDVARRREQPVVAAARTAALGGAGQVDGRPVRTLLDTMRGREDALLAQRELNTAEAYRTALITGGVSGAIGILVLGAVAALLTQNLRQRERSTAALFEQEERFRTTLVSIGDGVIATDPQANITLLNPVAESLTGWTSAEARGRPLTEVFRIVDETTRQPADNPAFRALRDGVIVGLANHTVLIARDGTEQPIDDSAAPIRHADNEVAGAVLVFRGVAERRKADLALEERLRLLQLRARIASALTEADGLEPMLDRSAAVLADHLGQSVVRLWVAEPPGTTLQLRARAGTIPDPVGWSAPVIVGEAVMGRLVANRRPRFSSTMTDAADVPDADWMVRQGLVSFVGLPLVMGQRLIGAAAIFAAQPLSDLTIGAFTSLAEELSIGIERQQAADEVRRLLARESERSRRLHQVTDAALTLNSATSRSSVVDVICAEARRILGAASAEIAPEAPAASSHVLSRELIGRGARPIGHLRVDGGEGRAFDELDETLLEQLAHMAAIAIENTTLYEELRENDRRKDEFLATLSHELRNPLAPIGNALQVMEMAGGGTDMMNRSRQVIQRQVRQMIRLVDDLLDLSRISLDKMELQCERVELAAVLRSSIETASPLITQFAHALTVDIASGPIPLDADVTRLSQVFANLLNNAAKYTPRGGRIWLVAARDGDEAVVTVRDTGIGIPGELVPHVFDLFLQGGAATAPNTRGLGIGLTLVRRLTEMHGGRVDVESGGRNLGSEFTVHLPVAVRPVAARPGADLAPLMRAARPRRILVVDDNRDTTDSMAEMLTMMGHEVRAAYDGGEAVEVAAAFKPDMALLDIGLPVLNGNEAARRIREQAAGRPLVLVAVTGWGQIEDRRRSRDAGFDHHMVKPMTFASLTKLLADLSATP